MSGDGRKSNKQFPGSTSRKNDKQPPQHRRDHGDRSNLPSTSWHVLSDTSNFIRNSPRSHRTNYHHQVAMDAAAIEDALTSQDLRNGLMFNGHAVSSEPNSQTSRRNSSSSALKCDNVTKYPDKKQIEDKLKQIREYLQVTTAMLGGLKNSENDMSERNGLLKMKNDLLDSESKLMNILEEINRTRSRLENNQTLVNNNFEAQSQLSFPGPSSHRNDSFDSQANGVGGGNDSPDLDVLREQQLSLLKLQQKAENRLRDARLVQERMTMGTNPRTSINVISEQKDKNMSLGDFDYAIKELEERAKRLNQNSQQRNIGHNACAGAAGDGNVASDRIMNEIENLHDQILGMRTANNEREELIEVLDTRDSELRSQQAELQKKLSELQNKKLQVDQLALQLQNINDEEEDCGGSDMDTQVSKIVTMKDQLKKLKDMLEIVKTTETVMTNNCSPEAQLTANEICQTAENFLQNQIHKTRPLQIEQNIGMRFENNCVVQKETNSRNQMDGAGSRQKPSSSSINEKLALKAELEARKRELEEIMGKHKAGTSNLNHDVGAIDNKSDYGSSLAYPQFWKSRPNQEHGSNGFSSEDENEYSEVHEIQNVLHGLRPSTTSPSGGISSNRQLDMPPPRGRLPIKSEYDMSSDRLHSFSRSPERNLNSFSATASEINANNVTRVPDSEGHKLQKQLQLIKNVCDSVLQTQQQQVEQTSYVQQQAQQSHNYFPHVRNNITPSVSVCSEPPSIANNPAGCLQPVPEVTWLNQFNPSSIPPPQPPDCTYQNWLATNTLQTQSFMLNTLNQCCQMLWLQQREMASLRNAVVLLQEKIDSHHCPSATNQVNLEQNHHVETPRPASNCNLLYPQHAEPSNRSNLTQLNQVSAACSMPNLNQYNTSSPINQTMSNFECLNNAASNLNLQVSTEHLNNMLHSLNSSNPVNVPHIWNDTALNNQVPPGNRANNYWDNFRSYSRQNLLSTKNTECSHASATADRTNPLLSVCVPNKSSNSNENTPRRKMQHNFVNQGSNSIEHVQNLSGQLHNLSVQAQNMTEENNENTPLTSRLEASSIGADNPVGSNEDVGLSSLQALLSLQNSNTEHSLNISEASTPKDCLNQRNEWHEEQQSKMNKSDESRENVYKQVTSQLFKDLQHIESDSLRLRVLQYLQNYLGQRLNNKQAKEMGSEQYPRQFSGVWDRPSTSSFGPLQMCLNPGELMIESFEREIMQVLDAHDSEFVNNQLLLALKQVFLNSEAFRDTFKDTVFQKHFSNVLEEELEQFRGKKVQDIKMPLIQSAAELLHSEVSFIHLLQKTQPGNLVLLDNQESPASFNNEWQILSSLDMNVQPSNPNGSVNVIIENGDLAEADQSRLTGSEVEEDERNNIGDTEETQQTSSEDASNSQDFSSNGEGLDQVPTRLPTITKSRSSTPNKELKIKRIANMSVSSILKRFYSLNPNFPKANYKILI